MAVVQYPHACGEHNRFDELVSLIRDYHSEGTIEPSDYRLSEFVP